MINKPAISQNGERNKYKLLYIHFVMHLLELFFFLHNILNGAKFARCSSNVCHQRYNRFKFNLRSFCVDVYAVEILSRVTIKFIA